MLTCSNGGDICSSAEFAIQSAQRCARSSKQVAVDRQHQKSQPCRTSSLFASIAGEWWLAPLILEFMDLKSLIVMETTGLFCNDRRPLLHSFRMMAKKLGAVCYETQAVLGESCEPKLEVLRWLTSRSTFAPFALTDGPNRRLKLVPQKLPTKLQTEPCHSEPSQNGFRVAPQLPRAAQPAVPLVYGTLKGWPLYAEFLFAWEEHGNGEACQLGVSVGGSQEVQLKFSPSAGAIFQHRPEGSFRTWPMDDLWVDAYQPRTQTFLEAGVHIGVEGKITFYRKGPYTHEHKGGGARQLVWEVAGGFDCSFPGASEQFHIVLCVLDDQTPLEAKILRVGTEPPVPPVPARQAWQMSVTPSDEAFAAFRVKNVLDQVVHADKVHSEHMFQKSRGIVSKVVEYHDRCAACAARAIATGTMTGLDYQRLSRSNDGTVGKLLTSRSASVGLSTGDSFTIITITTTMGPWSTALVISDAAQVAPPIVVHIRTPEILPATGASAFPTPSPVEPPSTPLTSAALQRHEALMQQQQGDHSATDAMAQLSCGQAGIPASLSLGMSMHQGAVFGVVSTIAVEAMQITLAEKRGNAADQTASIASAAVRGAVVGAAGGGMALMLGPTAPTGYSWAHSEITGPVALNRAVEVSGSAAGGVAGAMAAATLLSGCGGVVVAAAAGCSGFAGSLGGREVAALCFQSLSSETATKRRTSRCSSGGSSTRRRNSRDRTSFEPELLKAYSLLGVDPRCTNTELKHAFRRAVALHSAEVLPGDGAACPPFAEVLRAMELIRSTRQVPLLDVRHLDGGENLRICRRPFDSLPLQSHSQLASFIGGMAAQPTTSVAF
ncbi:unnamed protein product [Symbiodinium sp. KB8]|nr:unnamed protein product [Symbiodinium sp. KB8]